MEEDNEDGVFVPPDGDIESISEEEEHAFITAAELGKDRDTFVIFGNEVELHTLTIKETLESAKITKQYVGTKAEWVALKTAVVACAIDTINGEPFHTSISIDEPTTQRRFKKLADNYYSDFVSECYEKYVELEERQRKLLDTLKKAQA